MPTAEEAAAVRIQRTVRSSSNAPESSTPPSSSSSTPKMLLGLVVLVALNYIFTELMDDSVSSHRLLVGRGPDPLEPAQS